MPGIGSDQQVSRGSDSEPDATYRPLQRRASWARRLLVAGIVIDVLAVASTLMERSLLADAASGEILTSAEADRNDLRQLAVGLLQGGVFTLTAVAFLHWFSRAYRNLAALGASGLRRRYGWAVGSWFVPFLNLWRPKEIANDIWRASDPDAPADQGVVWKGDPVPKVYLAWWLAYLSMTWLYSFSWRRAVRAEEITELQAVNALYVWADLLSILAGGLALLVVGRTTARQTARAERLGLVPQEDRTPIWRRRSAWAALLATLVGFAFQGLIAVAAWSGNLSPQGDELTPRAPRAAGSGALFADDFSRTGVWLVQDDSTVALSYASGRYSILVKASDSLWSSSHALSDDADSISVEADAIFKAGRARTDWYGVSCLASSRGSYLFGISPDGYYTIGFDPGGDQELVLNRLVEDRINRRFSPDHAVNRLRATCVREGGRTDLKLEVNGVMVAERTHRRSLGHFVGAELFAYSGKGGTNVWFDDLVVRDTTSP